MNQTIDPIGAVQKKNPSEEAQKAYVFSRLIDGTNIDSLPSETGLTKEQIDDLSFEFWQTFASGRHQGGPKNHVPLTPVTMPRPELYHSGYAHGIRCALLMAHEIAKGEKSMGELKDMGLIPEKSVDELAQAVKFGTGKNESKYITISAASKLLGIPMQTLRYWDNTKRLVAHRTPTGRRVYLTSEIDSIFKHAGTHAAER